MSAPSPAAAPTSRAERRRTRTKRRWLRNLGIVALVAVLAVGGSTLWAWWKLDGQIDRVSVSDKLGTDRPTPAAGPLNILLVGSDDRSGDGNQGFGDGSWEPGAHADTTLLLHLSADRQAATVVSIPRDSMTEAPPECSPTAERSTWQIRQFNKNYTEGGPGCLIRTVEGLTGVFIHHFAVVDFGGFKNMVDALGGVPVCTTTPINDEKAGLVLAAGRHILNGKQALGYVRARYTLGDGSDLGRIKRQQAFLASVAQEATKSSLLLRPDKLYSFLSAATESLTTDEAFTVGTMQDIAASVRSLGIKNIKFVTVPTEQYAPDPNRVQWSASAERIWTAIQEDRPVNSPTKPSPSPSVSGPSLSVAPAEISVVVSNDSGVSGLASSVAQKLRDQGFGSVSTANGPAAVTPLRIVHAPGQAEAARTVAAAFPTAVLEESTSVTAIEVHLGPGAPDPVTSPGIERPSTPAGSPSPSATIEERAADEDICS